MKKIITLSLVLVMAILFSVAAFAAPGRFVSSPSGNLAPVLVDFDLECEDCDAKVIVTPYSDRDDLTEKDIADIEKAYCDIAKRQDSDSLEKVLSKLAQKKKLTSSDLSVSDLFDISCNDDYHNKNCPKGYTITLKADTLNEFVGVIRLNNNGEWEEVKVLEYNEKDGTVKIYTEELSPFAFVVNKNYAPNTGDESVAYLWGIIAVASGLIFILVAPKAVAKKSKV